MIPLRSDRILSILIDDVHVTYMYGVRCITTVLLQKFVGRADLW
eukprot:CAMPEP_0196804604 /NCGR_PEP_ID=MMETSP1362-20130617/4243_1 /TAXON_ID=163516 /ORGANISM="Leptocylindrus danicus, Strain CCMP1856" /LENGTH=43 /DNA_ID= /DNA_START= /DNA_END= /DNA_ORIENTATION=